MSTYTITSYGTNANNTEWSYFQIGGTGDGIIVSGDTVLLGNDIGSSGTPLTALSSITIPTGATFDGQGYKIYINITSFNSCIKLRGGTLQNLGLDASSGSTLTEYEGGIATQSSDGYIYNCHSNIDVTNNNSGGICGTHTTANDLTIERCTWTGSLTGGFSGGIISYVSNNNTVTLTINECYTNVTSAPSGMTLYQAGICGMTYRGTLIITNCYSFGNFGTNRYTRSGIVNIHNNDSGLPLTITNCYTTDDSLIYSSNAASSLATTVTNCIAAIRIAANNSTINAGSTNNSTTLTDIQGALGGPATSWNSSPTDVWTAGSGTDYPMLNQFSLGPWTGYTAYNTNATLTGAYTGGGGRAAAISGAGGDPHMNPLIGKPFTLPKTEDTFLLIDNKVDHDRLIIKGKCWYLPKEQYQDPLNRASDRNASKLNKLKDLFENGTFFKYIKIEYKGKEVVIDMDDLSLKNYDGKANLYSGKLPNSDKQGFKYGDMLTVGRITGSDKGLYTATSTKTSHDTSYRTIMRTVEINTLDNKLTIELARDRKNIARRNSIKLSVNGNASKFGGALIRKDVQIIDF